MAWGRRNGARTFCSAITEEAEIKKTNENLVFRSTYTNFNLLRSLKLGCKRQVALLWETKVSVVATDANVPRRRKNCK